MKYRIVLLAATCCCFLSAVAQAQENAGPGPVWRITLVKVKPGKMSEAMTDIRQNFKPVYDEAKRQGLIADFKVYTNVTRDGSADWDIMTALAFKNWAALDEVGSKMNAIILKHYGSPEKRQAAGEHRREIGEIISERFIREASLNPPPQTAVVQPK